MFPDSGHSSPASFLALSGRRGAAGERLSEARDNATPEVVTSPGSVFRRLLKRGDKRLGVAVRDNSMGQSPAAGVRWQGQLGFGGQCWPWHQLPSLVPQL